MSRREVTAAVCDVPEEPSEREIEPDLARAIGILELVRRKRRGLGSGGNAARLDVIAPYSGGIGRIGDGDCL